MASYTDSAVSDCSNYRVISLISLRKLLSIIVLIRPVGSLDNMQRPVDKVSREESRGIRKERGCVDKIFMLSVITDKCLDHHTTLVLGFID